MSILNTVFRRIVVRTVDKTVTNQGRNLFFGLGDYNPKFPSKKGLLINLLIYTVICFLLIKFFLIYGKSIFPYLVPLLFIKSILNSLFVKYIYSKVQKPITVNDRRNSSGVRIVGYKYVKDEENKIDLSIKQIKISRAEGIIKLVIAALFIFYINSYFKSSEFKITQLTELEKLQLLKPNETIYIDKNSNTNDKYFLRVKTKKEISKFRDKTKKFDTSFNSITYKLNEDELGTVLFIDSSTGWGKFVAFKPTQKINLTKENYNIGSDIIRVDTFLYVLLNDILIKPTKLNKK